MADIRMQKGEVLSLKVEKVVESRRSYPKGNDIHYVHDIYVSDKNGNESRKEYVTTTQTIPRNVIEIGVYQYFRCRFANEKGDEVEPYDPEARPTSPQQQYQTTQRQTALPQGAAEQSGAINKFAQSQEQQARSLSMCLAYAKDLKVAEISKRKAGSTITEDDILQVTAWAIKLQNGMNDFLSL